MSKVKLMLLIIALFVPVVFHFNPNLIYALKLVHAVQAKSFCSCYFVEKRGREVCEDKVDRNLPYMKYSIDGDTISFGRFSIAKAKFHGLRFGCTLE